jgi:hypothetical protein
MKQVSLVALVLAGVLVWAARAGGNGSGTSNGDPDRDVLDVVHAGGNGSGTSNGDPDRDVLDRV